MESNGSADICILQKESSQVLGWTLKVQFRFEKKTKDISIFTRGNFWPSGILIGCICVSVNHKLVCTITHHKFELESSNLDQKLLKKIV